MSTAAATQLPVIDLRIADERWAVLGDAEVLAARALGRTAAETGETGEVSILLTSDAEMRALNKQWRNLDKPTDVLSFPSPSLPSGGPEIPGEPRHLGDIAMGFETAMADAEAMKRPFEGHFTHLLIHGFLHLIGYDHIDPEDAAEMEPLETKLLASLGWPDPYSSGPYASGPYAAEGEG